MSKYIGIKAILKQFWKKFVERGDLVYIKADSNGLVPMNRLDPEVLRRRKLTKAEYEELSDEEKAKNIDFVITDAEIEKYVKKVNNIEPDENGNILLEINQTQADWDETVVGSHAYIKNKPQLGTISKYNVEDFISSSEKIPTKLSDLEDDLNLGDGNFVKKDDYEITADEIDRIVGLDPDNNEFTVSYELRDDLIDKEHTWSSEKINAEFEKHWKRVDSLCDTVDDASLPIGVHFFDSSNPVEGTLPYTSGYGIWIRQKFDMRADKSTNGLIDIALQFGDKLKIYTRYYNNDTWTDWLEDTNILDDTISNTSTWSSDKINKAITDGACNVIQKTVTSTIQTTELKKNNVIAYEGTSNAIITLPVIDSYGIECKILNTSEFTININYANYSGVNTQLSLSAGTYGHLHSVANKGWIDGLAGTVWND